MEIVFVHSEPEKPIMSEFVDLVMTKKVKRRSVNGARL